MPERSLRILVIDDSAVMRQLLAQLLSAQPGVEVSVAADPIIAFGKIARARPDVVLLDLEMPRMDGLTFLQKLMLDDPLPVVVCSGHAAPGTDLALRALEHGAVEIVGKPVLGLRGFLEHSAIELLEIVRAAAAARPLRRPVRTPPKPRLWSPAATPHIDTSRRGGPGVIALGASTGGTEALRSLLDALPLGLPGIVIVQHMPAQFTRAFAARLNQSSALEVREARHGDGVVSGRALVAPGDRHVEVVRASDGYRVKLHDGPPISRHRPSVDVLFDSLARNASGVVAALLTGMGDDGARGLLALRRAGARTIAQDEASSVVFGMPREAIAMGAAERVVALDRMAEALVQTCASARFAETLRTR